eukprot:1158573-Pelagomonas_calceolata.AAC.6
MPCKQYHPLVPLLFLFESPNPRSDTSRAKGWRGLKVPVFTGHQPVWTRCNRCAARMLLTSLFIFVPSCGNGCADMDMLYRLPLFSLYAMLEKA